MLDAVGAIAIVINSNRQSYFRTAAYIRLHARWRPDRLAVIGNGRRVCYAALDRDLGAMARALRGFGLAPGATVAIGHADLYVHMLLLLGFEMLGVTTASFRPGEGEACHGLLAGAALTITQAPAPNAPMRRLFIITDDWLAAALATPGMEAPVTQAPIAEAPVTQAPVARAAADEGAVILRSSGTTGRPKRMLVTHRMLNTRLSQHCDLGTRIGLYDGSRLLAVMHFSTVSTILAVHNFLRHGATFMFETQCCLLDSMLAHRPTRMIMLPFQLQNLLVALPRDGARRGPMFPDLLVRSVGAPIAAEVRRDALARLCGRIANGYGSNEAGRIAAIDGGGDGTITLGIEVEVVDQAGRRLPAGETGWLRMRGDGVVHGYLEDWAASAESFRDGWFYPGDTGALPAPGVLKLSGRRGDIVNLGGIKMASVDLENHLLAAAPFRDVAVWQAEDLSEPPVVVCAVLNRPIDRPALARVIGSLITGPFRLAVVPAIPRTANGKIRRAALRDLTEPVRVFS